MEEDVGWRHIPQSGIKALCRPFSVTQSSKLPNRLIDQLGVPPTVIPPSYALSTQLRVSSLEQLSNKELRKAQDRDPDIGVAKQAVQSGVWPPTSQSYTPEVALLQRESSSLLIKSGTVIQENHQIIGPADFSTGPPQ